MKVLACLQLQFLASQRAVQIDHYTIWSREWTFVHRLKVYDRVLLLLLLIRLEVGFLLIEKAEVSEVPVVEAQSSFHVHATHTAADERSSPPALIVEASRLTLKGQVRDNVV